MGKGRRRPVSGLCRRGKRSSIAGDFAATRAGGMEQRKAAILAELPRLRRYSRALLRDPDAADDLVQDCLERALRRLDNWQTDENPRRWLFTIMHNLFIDQTRRTRRRAEVVTLTLDDSEAVSAPAEQHESIATREIMDALQEIRPDRRAAILLVGLEGFSYAEAATLLGVPAGTLMSRVSRGREELRGLLDDFSRRRVVKVVER